MTGKVIDSSANGLLILILPIAFLIVLLFKAWPVLLALFILSIIFKIWQQYQWKQWSKQVNPYFNELIKENQGCLTPLDLSMKANLSGSAARRYLDKKAEEFGAQRQDYEDKGTVYYFLTASALGSIFDESEPPLELESESASSQALKSIELDAQPDTSPPKSESSLSALPEPPEPLEEQEPSDLSEPPEPPEKEEPSVAENAFSTEEIEEALEPMPQPEPEQTESLNTEEALEPMPQAEPEQTEFLDEQEDLWAAGADKEPQASQSLIQAELAKRLDVHSSTVGKRKSDPDFSEWSQSRDPEGMAWAYSAETKEFVPVEAKPESEA
ncbi:MAG: hypothetical protein M3O33_18310 [Cyanobacteriota bacterium]|nr:hypothetical protein [Cyanobacteriota bacterium]